ncbi:hypothetical protein K7X08_012137 [Anisodus acutangulus]|uniref:Uncharacterized protein n=1 Tax=Anisodus acutangulus TaxID=402998 RepID=A0A9Q1LD06_9SOLA|nr:hypothetical protein K7X08_012137 [Anisodus acutangulus]
MICAFGDGGALNLLPFKEVSKSCPYLSSTKGTNSKFYCPVDTLRLSAWARIDSGSLPMVEDSGLKII